MEYLNSGDGSELKAKGVKACRSKTLVLCSDNHRTQHFHFAISSVHLPYLKFYSWRRISQVNSIERAYGDGRKTFRKEACFARIKTSCILGMELNHGDSPHAMGRRLQLASMFSLKIALNAHKAMTLQSRHPKWFLSYQHQ